MSTEQAVRLPDFIVAGVAKAGTTSLYAYLDRSPKIAMPTRKEGRFLSHTPRTFRGPKCEIYNQSIPASLQDYAADFARLDQDALTGDISPDYFYYAESFTAFITKLYDELPPVYVVLRDPVRRAYSHYLYMRQLGLETLPFAEALAVEQERIASGWPMGFHYLEASRYARRLAHLREQLGDRLTVFVYEDHIDAAAIAALITRALGVPPPPAGHAESQNETFVPRSQLLHGLVHGDHAWKRPLRALLPAGAWVKVRSTWRKLTSDRPPLDPAVAARLSDALRLDRIELSALLGRSLDPWPDSRRSAVAEAQSD